MIRAAKEDDARAIADIYNEYVKNTAITLETEPVSEQEMATHFAKDICYFVYEEEENILGYCYAHRWKTRAAY